MPRPVDKNTARQLLQAQLDNYKATREGCREPQRSIFTALIQQLERELSETGIDSQSPTAAEGSAA